MASLFKRLHGIFVKTNRKSSAVPSPTKAATISKSTPKRKSSPLPKPPISDKQKIQSLVATFKKLSDSKSFRCRSKRYESAVRRFVRAKQFSAVKEILDHQKNYPDITREDFVVRLITLYGKAQMFDDAQKLFEEMPDLKCNRTVFSFSSLLAAGLRSGNYAKVTELFEELPQKLSIEPNVISFNSVIKAYTEMGSFESAVLMIRKMEMSGLEPDLWSFTTILCGLYKNGNLLEGDKLWEIMEAKGITPQVRCYDAKLRALSKAKRFSEALELFDEMKQRGIKPESFTFNAMIKGYVDDGNLKEAKVWYQKMAEKDNCGPNFVAYQMLIPLACEKDEVDFALELCKTAIETETTLYQSVFQLVVNKLASHLRNEEAEDLVSLVKSWSSYYKLQLPN